MRSNCDNCTYYVWDDEGGYNTCLVSLDEDEMYKFLSGADFDCPYFSPDDEYSIAKKQ